MSNQPEELQADPEPEPTAKVSQHTTIVEGGPSLSADENLLDSFDESTTEIDVTHMRVRSLDALGLARFKNVKEVCFRQNLLTTIMGVEALPSDLVSLDLYDNQISHMDRRLEHFGPQLETLDLSFNNLRHIKHIQNLTGLKDLFFCQNDITRISGLEGLVNLRNLELGANRIREIKGLDELVNLESLWLAKNKISKLEGLGKLKKLRLLSIQSNRITKIEGLDELDNLQELYLSHNGIEKIEGLENNKQLHTLDVGNNRIRHIEGLAHLTDLQELWASYNPIEDVREVRSELGHLASFSTIYLEHTPLQQMAGANYENQLRNALGPSLEQIDANAVRPMPGVGGG